MVTFARSTSQLSSEEDFPSSFLSCRFLLCNTRAIATAAAQTRRVAPRMRKQIVVVGDIVPLLTDLGGVAGGNVPDNGTYQWFGTSGGWRWDDGILLNGVKLFWGKKHKKCHPGGDLLRSVPWPIFEKNSEFLLFDVYSFVFHWLLGSMWWKNTFPSSAIFSLNFLPIFTCLVSGHDNWHFLRIIWSGHFE